MYIYYIYTKNISTKKIQKKKIYCNQIKILFILIFILNFFTSAFTFTFAFIITIINNEIIIIIRIKYGVNKINKSSGIFIGRFA